MGSVYESRVLKQAIDARVVAYFASPETRMGVQLSPNGEQVLDLLAEFTARPSKRLRGILAMVAYRMFGGTSEATALDVALAMELAQSYLLLIDDVMDRSDTRRGGPTVHQEYIQLLHDTFSQKDVAHESNMAAVIAGELAQHLASLVLNGVDEPAARVLKAERLFHVNIATTAHGQIDDLFGSLGQPQTITETLAMYVRKTCHYTFVGPLQTGAVLAGADIADLAALQTFGVHAGIAFQLQDDDIGMFGDAHASGKSTLDDLREGKLTVLMRHALEHATGQDLQVLQSLLGNKDVTGSEHASVQLILERVGSRAYMQQEMGRANAAAIAVLDTQKQWDKSARQFLAELVTSLTNRSS